MFTGRPSVTVSMEMGSVDWRGLSNESYFGNHKSKPGLRHTVGGHAANFALGH